MPPPIDLTGRKFGRLTVLRQAGRRRSNVLWLCSCECGGEKVTIGNSLKSGDTQSCGCLRVEHGLTGSPTYISWANMLRRCNNPTNKNYSHYGGRGIVVCESWHKFINFLSDMGEKPTERHTIERLDNNRGYSPDNCKWDTRIKQARNRRIRSTNKSGTTGVYWEKLCNKYAAGIYAGGQQINLGYFSNLEDAIIARKAGEQKYWSDAFQE